MKVEQYGVGGVLEHVAPRGTATADLVRKHAAHFGADYLFLPDRAHSLILEPRCRDVADRVSSWLRHSAW